MSGPRLLAVGDPALAPSGDLVDVVEVLDSVEPPSIVADGMRRYAEEHPDALERTNAMGHFTGSACVLDSTGQRTLLMFHRKLQRWLQPGGHADGDANLVAVALREATEETGIHGLRIDPEPIDVDVHVIPTPHPGATGSHLHLDVRFLVVAPADAVAAGNDESEALCWVDRAVLDDERHRELGIDAGTVRMLRAAFARFDDVIS